MLAQHAASSWRDDLGVYERSSVGQVNFSEDRYGAVAARILAT